MKKKIAILGANEPLRSFYSQTKKLGYEIHSFAWPEGAVCKEYADCFYPISFTEKEEIARICSEIGINGIISFSLESALPTVNFVAKELGVPGNPEECSELTKNKFTMREQLKKCNVNVPEYVLIDKEEDINNVNIELPVIVKPIDSGGSRGITKVNKKNQLVSAYYRALEHSKSKKVLIEQFIGGREFSIEYISNQGQHYYITSTDKVTTGHPYFVELEHHQPADVSSNLLNKIKLVSKETLDALKIFSSASHIELKMNGFGDLFVIEVGARMGGDMISSDLVRLSTGYDFVDGAIRLAVGDFVPPIIENNKYSGIYYLCSESAQVLPYINDSTKFPQIVDKSIELKSIIPIRESNDRAGYFIYQDYKKFEIS